MSESFHLPSPAHRLPERACPACGRVLDRASGQDSPPESGDLSVCIGCASVNVFADDGATLRRPTHEELVEALARPQVHSIVRAVLDTLDEGT